MVNPIKTYQGFSADRRIRKLTISNKKYGVNQEAARLKDALRKKFIKETYCYFY